MNELTTNLIQETKELYTAGKRVMIQVAANLRTIKDENEWQQYGYQKFPEFCEAVLDIGPSQVSKFEKITDFFLGTYTPDEIGPVDYEKLYQSARLGGDVGTALERAKKWNRADFKKQKAEQTPHDPVWVTYCSVCKQSKETHD